MGTVPSGIGGRARSASVTLMSAWRTTALMRCQGSRTWQLGSWTQWPGCTVHSVSPIGPSSAVIISADEISSGGRARL